MAPGIGLQLAVAGGGLLALAGTFALAVAFYAVTAHVAARYVLGAVDRRRAVLVGVVPAGCTMGLEGIGPGLVLGVALVADYLAVLAVYRPSYRLALGVTVVHFAVSVIVGVAVVTLLGVLGAPV